MRFNRKLNKKILLAVISVLVIAGIVSIFIFISYKKAVVKNDGYYFLDAHGDITYSHLIDPLGEKYKFGEDGYAYCKHLCARNENGDYSTSGIIDNNGNVVGDKTFEENDISVGKETIFPIMLCEDGEVVIYDKDFQKIGQVENNFDADRMDVGSGFSEGLGSAWICMGEKSLCGYVNTKGEWVIEPRYTGGAPFSKDGLACVRNPETDLWGYIDMEGNEIIDFQFYQASDFSEGFALVQKEKDGKAAYINTKGECITDYIFDYRESQKGFSEGMAFVKKYGEKKMGYINEHGEMVIEPKYDVTRAFSYGMAPVSDGDYGRDVYINKEGETVLDLNLHGLVCYSFTKDGYATVLDYPKQKFGIIDAKGEWLFSPQFTNKSGAILDYEVPVFENGHCFVYLEKGQIIKKPKKK